MLILLQEGIQLAVLDQLRMSDPSKQESLSQQQFFAAVLRPGTLSRPALVSALAAQDILCNADEVASQGILELQAYLAEVIDSLTSSEHHCLPGAHRCLGVS